MDTSFATLVTDFFKTQMSTFSAAPNSILSSISFLPIAKGKRTIDRIIQDPETIVHASKTWDGRRAKKVTLKQNVDTINLGDGLEIPRDEFNADPEGARIHVQNTGEIFNNAIEKTTVEGVATIAIARGINDFPDGTAGTINRPEIAYNNTTAGDWKTVANFRTDVIESVVGLTLKRFYGPKLMLAPEIVRTMITELISNTAVPVSSWMTSTIGIPIAFSPFVHEAATKDDFNCYIIDTNKVHLGGSDILFDAWYEQKDHAYYWDWDVDIVPLFDPLFDGTEYLKGVARLDARDFSD
ncbi:hypothetical protein LCGC14_0976150 [marine sediment metagenome]|uniref:Uncharacterized protein n=1 Tax=marine sediment metagenome TaxID=412755 RepID=A0A0F9LSW3_9ZZZZ